MTDTQKSDMNSNQSLNNGEDIAKRKREEEALRARENFISSVLRAAPIGIGVVSNRILLTVNDRISEMIGYTVEELVGKSARILYPSDAEFESVGAEKYRQISERGTGIVETRWQCKDGRIIDVLLSSTPINPRDLAAGVTFTVLDITDRKHAEKETWMLKHSIDVHYDGAYWMDSDNKFVYVNDAGCKALGYTREELIGKTIHEVSPRANTKLMKEVWARLRQSGSFSIESVHRRKDGSEFPVEVVITYVCFGGKEYACGFARDITERRKAADSLIHSHNLMQNIISHAQSAIAVHDRDLKYVYVSEQYLREYKVKEQDVIGKHHYEVFPDLPQKWRDVHQRVLAGAVESSEKDPYIREDGSVDWTRWECRPWYETDGSIGGLIVYTEVITERIEAAKLLQQQRAQLEEAQRISHVGSWERDISTNAVRWSDELMRIFGVTPGEQKPTFQMLLDMMHSDDRELFQKAVKEAVFNKKPYSIEYRIVCGDDSTRYIHARGEAQYDSSGKPLIFRGTAQDITERKKMEMTVMDSEMRYRNLFEQSGDSILVMKIGKDNVPLIMDMNETALRTHGYSREELVGQPISILDPDTDIGVDDKKIKTLKNNKFGIFTTQHKRKDGSLIDVEVRARLISIGGEEVIVSSERDITERKRMEESLRKDEEFIRNILDTVDEEFIVIDQDYRIVTANKAYCASASCNDLIGKHCYEISHRRNIPCYEAGEECAVWTVFETGRPYTVIHTHQDKDGQPVYVETKAFPIKDSAGNVISAIETINNITEKHLLEEERLKTQKLEAIGTLAGGIAHDFNNLLQGVFGYISLAKLNADQKEKSVAALEQAEKALHMSVNLTSQLLTFSKGGKPVKELVDLRPVIENAARFALSGSRSDYLLDISGDLWAANVDSGQIGQVIQNIVLNADQSMPEGGHVEITAANVEAPNDLPQGLKNGRYVKISIKDNGVGIPEQYFTKIFDPYFTTKEKGSGLGLATSYSIVRNHGGLIDVRSLPGKGSTFAIYIPAAAPIKTIPVVAAAARPARRGRILVMDDDEVVRMVAGELIRALEHDVDFAEHGEEALTKYKAAREAGAPFDIVILDLTVRGGAGGVETIQKLREIDPGVKAVVSSGYSDNAATAEYQKIGFRSFLKKPYNIEELRITLNTLLT